MREIALINLLDNIKTLIINNEFEEYQKEQLYNYLLAYKNKDFEIDKELLECLFTGFIIKNLK